MNIMNKSGFNLLERSLDAAALRQKVIADNVANVDTPNFKRSDVRFEELLDQEMNGGGTLVGKRTDAKHIEIGRSSLGTPQTVQDSQTIMNNNGNNVDIDYEMALMAKNQLRYNVMVQQVNSEFKKMRAALGR
ncbi:MULTISPECIES: flagellar basal body rod protein FlgB [Paenibacillus]|uniref:flagellar basal body rod protein FlgB n=1 Tax=Paenibacillus TaxID=44249 RepID=UPI0022B90AF3|nr:flagellar basal body rod protein FlgB [Paenibacillus caseinilyticus]MCZ8520061.1 flagellar basal body rod protein FlgB [Paenibacillus caseinilyticus]